MPLLIKEHPLRRAGIAELHARTFEPLISPARIAHIALLCGQRGSGRNENHLRSLLQYFGTPIPTHFDQYYYADLGSLRLRWERHTEFVTYSFSQQGHFTSPFVGSPLDAIPQTWLQEMPGELIAAVLLALEPRTTPERDTDQIRALFGGQTIIGAEVAGGAGHVYSDLRLYNDGFMHLLVRDMALSEDQAGRLIKRILELSTYRAMALLGLPLARKVGDILSDADRRLANVAKSLTRTSSYMDIAEERTLLTELTTLATAIEAVTAQTAYRFEASRAYYQVVEQRLHQLRQQRIEGLQTFSEFLNARLAPAVATCVATSERQQYLAERAARLTGLLRARVEISLQEQNRSLLDSMDQRAHLQLRLQETVEGLSVIAISYYGLGLIGYFVKGLERYGYPFDATLTIGAAVPVVLLLAWVGLRWMKRRLHH
jgi:uncharacterized membrane-anchored protein